MTTLLSLSRTIALALAGVTTCSTIGGLILAPADPNGVFYALSTLTAGLAAAAVAWWWISGYLVLRGAAVLIAIMLCLAVGLGVESSAVTLLWLDGRTLAVKGAATGELSRGTWLGPAFLGWAGLFYAVIRLQFRIPRRA